MQSNSKKIAMSAMVLAIYVVLMYFSQSFVFGPYQVRIATSLYALAYLYPYLVLPLGLANGLSNLLLGGLGIFDTLGGLAVGLLTAGCAAWMARRGLRPAWLFLPVLLGPGLLVPIWLSYIFAIPYPALAASLCVGQVLPAIFGVMLVKYLQGKM